METYQVYKCKDRTGGILILSSIRNTLMLHFGKHLSALADWDLVMVQNDGTLTTRL